MTLMNHQFVPLAIVDGSSTAPVALEDAYRNAAESLAAERVVGVGHRQLRRNSEHLVKLTEQSYVRRQISVHGGGKLVQSSGLFAQLNDSFGHKRAFSGRSRS